MFEGLMGIINIMYNDIEVIVIFKATTQPGNKKVVHGLPHISGRTYINVMVQSGLPLSGVGMVEHTLRFYVLTAQRLINVSSLTNNPLKDNKRKLVVAILAF